MQKVEICFAGRFKVWQLNNPNPKFSACAPKIIQ